MSRYYTAAEAAEILGVSRNTLYAYVSRGLLRSETDNPGLRTKRYHAGDVESLLQKSEVHKSPVKAIKKALFWGTPILDSSITLIKDDALYYRGQDAAELADSASFEDVTDLLWGIGHSSSGALSADILKYAGQAASISGGDINRKMLYLLSVLNDEDIRAAHFTEDSASRAGRIIIDSYIYLLIGSLPVDGAAACLAKAWGQNRDAEKLINAALILTADHELNMSSFTARCSASAGSTVYAAVSAATCTFRGKRHGGNTERIYAMMRESGDGKAIYDTLKSYVRRGDKVPGFGHRIYSRDPRAEYLINNMPDSKGIVRQIMKACEDILSPDYPTVDTALILLEKELNLPDKAGAMMFYLGRLAGWTAHIIEQYALDQTIRPRARYTGINPK